MNVQIKQIHRADAYFGREFLIGMIGKFKVGTNYGDGWFSGDFYAESVSDDFREGIHFVTQADGTKLIFFFKVRVKRLPDGE